MRLLMTALGSYGDVLPMVGLASAMHHRGHQATIIANPHFRSVIEAAGVGFVAIGSEAEYDELTHHPDLWHWFRGALVVMRSGMRDLVRELYRLIDEHSQRGETVLVAHGLDLASRVHQDKHGTPVASVHLAPVALRSFDQSPQMFGMLMQDWVPRWLRGSQFWMADKISRLTPERDEARAKAVLNEFTKAIATAKGERALAEPEEVSADVRANAHRVDAYTIA